MRILLALLCGLLTLTIGALAAPLTVEEARASRDEAVQQVVRVNVALGDEYFHSGEWEKTVAALERVIRLTPREVTAYANAAWLLWSTNQTERALALYEQMIANNPEDPEAYYIYGQYRFTRQQYEEALPLLQRAYELGVAIPKRHLYGHCLVKLNHTDAAVQVWRQMLTDDPTDEVAARELRKLLPPAAVN